MSNDIYQPSIMQQLAARVLQERQSMDVHPALALAFHDEYASRMASQIQAIRDAQRAARHAATMNIKLV